MKLWNRFKRLGFWSRLGAIGAVCSVVGLVLALAGWLLFRGNGSGVSVSMEDSPAARIQVAANSPHATQIIADNVTIRLASPLPRPQLSAAVAYANRPEDGKYVTLVRLMLEAPFPVTQLYAEAHAPTIQTLKLNHDPPALIEESYHDEGEGYASDRLLNAKGRITAKLVSTQREKFTLVLKCLQ